MQIWRRGGRFWAENPEILHLHRCSARGFVQRASGFRPGVSTFLAFSLKNRGVWTKNCMAGGEKEGARPYTKRTLKERADTYGEWGFVWQLGPLKSCCEGLLAGRRTLRSGGRP